jgi:hypothetical protein
VEVTTAEDLKTYCEGGANVSLAVSFPVDSYPGEDFPWGTTISYPGEIFLDGTTCVIQGNGKTLDAGGRGRFFQVKNTGSSLQVHNLALVNGNGGPISYYDSGGGGAIYVSQGTLVIYDSTFESNMTPDTGCGPDRGGGAIYATNSNVQIHGSIFQSNTAPSVYGSGGAIAVYYGAGKIVKIYTSTFKSNTAGYYDDGCFYGSFCVNGGGGAVYAQDAIMEIHNTTFESNNAVDSLSGGYGGAIYTKDGTLVIQDSTFDTNIAGVKCPPDPYYGTIYAVGAQYGPPPCGGSGGGIYAEGATIALVQVTFSANTPDPYYGETFATHCHEGFFQNTTSKSCEQCLVGTYKDTEDVEATSCAKCPEGRFGSSIAAQSNSSHCQKCHTRLFRCHR